MTLFDIIRRSANPLPWSEGDNIPWHDPDFSRRMLDEHLTQAHDAASRRFEIIDRNVSAGLNHANEQISVRIGNQLVQCFIEPVIAKPGTNLYGVSHHF